MSATVLRGRDAFGGGGIDVVVDDGIITAMTLREPVADEPWIGPGLVDLQVNGHGEGDANAADPHPDRIAEMALSLAARGVTRFLPTVITASAPEMRARIRAIAEARRDPHVGSMIAGVHVEGPCLSPEDGPRGVHPREHIRPPDPDELQSWLDEAPGLIRIVTLSPHHPGTEEAIRLLVSQGVRVAVGHTHADDAQIRAAAAAGASLSTHLGNGAHAVLARHPNYLWSQLAEPRLAAGLIADGHHLPDETLSAMLAAKREHGAFLVSDAVATPAELREGGVSSVGGGVRIAPDGALRHAATGFLAGSIQALDTGVATAARVTGSLAEAVRLAAVAPARILDGAEPWRVGSRADVLRFHWAPGDAAIRPVSVHVQGRALVG
ncbi:N-acetylglucosamine-6-phosphate deacetylase [Microbacterium resistens]|uniref:N-acetylglucosamine-6-phosphate deacetylase n=1 Tax=Microbacterium resistens TaxID=156977 RepID=A0ABY3RSP2_9MICO|nr:N-acetylglucosamine-6-phosphate deacetylase [Microbacterium resistens]UGS25492.1 N-acetylglucosamine-6-phosphate deacetylase [Microbacterium resistens]